MMSAIAAKLGGAPGGLNSGTPKSPRYHDVEQRSAFGKMKKTPMFDSVQGTFRDLQEGSEWFSEGGAMRFRKIQSLNDDATPLCKLRVVH